MDQWSIWLQNHGEQHEAGQTTAEWLIDYVRLILFEKVKQPKWRYCVWFCCFLFFLLLQFGITPWDLPNRVVILSFLWNKEPKAGGLQNQMNHPRNDLNLNDDLSRLLADCGSICRSRSIVRSLILELTYSRQGRQSAKKAQKESSLWWVFARQRRRKIASWNLW